MPQPETKTENKPSMAGAAQRNRMLAESLAGPLRDACGGRLGEVTWFRTDWQRGGAATGYADWRLEDGSSVGTVVKLPVNARELGWLRRLQDPADSESPVPTLHAGGEGLNGYDIAWIVEERLPVGPLGGHWEDSHVERIAGAVARFHLRASRYPIDRPSRHEDWGTLVGSAREAIKVNAIDGRQHWTEALKTLSHRLEGLVGEWEARTPIEWLHGDLHLANAMARRSGEDAAVCLIDLAEVRPGHWVEDAVYLERLLWAMPGRVKKTRPVRAIADARKALGIAGHDHDARLANIRRLLLAGTAPAFMRSEGHPTYLKACLERVEQMLPLVR